MANNGYFIPEIWSARILSNLNNEHIAAKLVNRDYEGEIKGGGDTVRINSIGRITVTDYVKNVAHGAPEVLSDFQTTLTITESKLVHFMVDDIDKAQQKPKVMDEAMKEAAYSIAEEVDNFIFGKYVDAGTVLGAAGAVTLAAAELAPIDATAETFDFYKVAVLLRKALNKKNVRADGRFLVVDPEVEAMLLLDERFVKTGTSKGDEVLAKGKIGNIAGFEVYTSNNVPVTAGGFSVMIAGVKDAISYAEQFTNMESFRSQDFVADVVRGLHLYGAKVVRPDALAVAILDMVA